MPIDINTGQYVPLSPTEKQQITSYSAGVLRREPNISNRDLLLKIGQRSGVHIDQYDAIVLQNLIRNAQSENAAGATATASPNQAPDLTAIPTVFDDPADSGRIVTWYVVEVLDPLTGNVTTSMEVSVSAAPVSQQDLLDIINEDRAAYFRTMGSAPAIGGPTADLQITIIILSVSRAR